MSEADIVQLLCGNGGAMEYDRLLELASGFPDIDCSKFDSLLRNKEHFFLTEIAGVKQVLAKTSLRLCKVTDCSGCKDLHLCKFYLHGECSRRQCRYGHDLNSDHNAEVLSDHQLRKFSRAQIRQLLLQNDTPHSLLPPICAKYNHGDGEYGQCEDKDECGRLHICEDFMRHTCDGDTCRRSHHLFELQPVRALCGRGVSTLQVGSMRSVYHHILLLRGRRQGDPGGGGAGAVAGGDAAAVAKRRGRGGRGRGGGGRGRGRGSKDKDANQGGTGGRGRGRRRGSTDTDKDPDRGGTAGTGGRGRGRRRGSTDTDKDPDQGGTAGTGGTGGSRDGSSPAQPEVAEICLSFVKGFCKYENRCVRVHCKMPYLWQVRCGDTWSDLDNNEDIERDYCNPNYISNLSVPGLPLLFDSMRCGDQEVRRLSTAPSVQMPDFILTTEWIWYWQNETSIWDPYIPSMCSELEKRYQADSQDVVLFTAGKPQQQYQVSIKDMEQRNVFNGTVRVVRRRPKFISADGIQTAKTSNRRSSTDTEQGGTVGTGGRGRGRRRSSTDTDKDPDQGGTVGAAGTGGSRDGGRPTQPEVAEICLSFVKGICKYENRCVRVHCKMPYLWQVRSGDTWSNLDNNEDIERDYCNPDYITTFSLQGQPVHFDSMRCGDQEVRRLSTAPSVNLPDFILTTEWIWYWQNEKSIWIQYIPPMCSVSSCDLEKRYQADSKDVVLFTGGRPPHQQQQYQLSFKDMEQRNVCYGTVRVVRRRPKFISADGVQTARTSRRRGPASSQPGRGVPGYWDKSAVPDTGYQRVTLLSSDRDYLKVQELFSKTLTGYDIISIERVQNKELWEDFQTKRERMQKANKDKKYGDGSRLLFHGTDPKHVQAICHHNFDWRKCGANGTVYGEGCYFARDARYSHDYTKEVPDQGGHLQRCMFVCRVLIGSYTRGQSHYRLPPSVDGGGLLMYDSCVNDVRDPSIFVVFDKQQVYPEFLLTYTEHVRSSSSSDSHDASGFGLLQPVKKTVTVSTLTSSSVTPPPVATPPPVVTPPPTQSPGNVITAQKVPASSGTPSRSVTNISTDQSVDDLLSDLHQLISLTDKYSDPVQVLPADVAVSTANRPTPVPTSSKSTTGSSALASGHPSQTAQTKHGDLSVDDLLLDLDEFISPIYITNPSSHPQSSDPARVLPAASTVLTTRPLTPVPPSSRSTSGFSVSSSSHTTRQSISGSSVSPSSHLSQTAQTKYRDPSGDDWLFVDPSGVLKTRSSAPSDPLRSTASARAAAAAISRAQLSSALESAPSDPLRSTLSAPATSQAQFSSALESSTAPPVPPASRRMSPSPPPHLSPTTTTFSSSSSSSRHTSTLSRDMYSAPASGALPRSSSQQEVKKKEEKCILN